MMHMAFFATILLLSSGYSMWWGGAPERRVGAAMLAAYVATLFSHSDFVIRFTQVEVGVLVIDLALMLVLAAVALKADRGWPFLLAGLHLTTLGAHAARVLHSSMIEVTYAVMLTMWSYPMVVALAIGTWRHQKRLRVSGYDRDWSLPFDVVSARAGNS